MGGAAAYSSRGEDYRVCCLQSAEPHDALDV